MIAFLMSLARNQIKESADSKPDERGPPHRYKILIHPIESYRAIAYTPLGVLVIGKSELSAGHRIGVKERSPRLDFNEQRDTSDILECVQIIDEFKVKYKVDNNEVYYCGNGERPF